MNFGLFSKKAPKIFLIFCMSVKDKWVHRLSKIVSMKKILNPGLQVIKCPQKVFCDSFGLFSKTAQGIFLIFCMSIEDNKAHPLRYIAFIKTIYQSHTIQLLTLLTYNGNMVHKYLQLTWMVHALSLFWLEMSQRAFSLHFWPNNSKDLPNFLPYCRGQ